MQPITELRATKRRLDSWKEIAAFFDRDERTVRRWEREKALPVHRLPGSARGRVFAFTDELAHWMNSAGSSEVAVLDLPRRDSSAGASDSDHRRWPRRKTPWLYAAVVLAITAVGGLILLLASRHSIQTKSASAQPSVASQETPPPPSINPQAQDLYLKGRYYWNKRTPEDLNRAVDFFTQAIVHDPNYAQAYVGLADSYNLLREFTAMPAEEAFPRALAASRKAVELDPSSAEAHNSLAFVTFYWNWDVPGAEKEFRRALELNPNYVTAHHWYATFLMAIGRLPEALEEIDRAQQLDPSSTPILADKGLILFHLGKTEESLTLLKQLEEAQPGFYSTHNYLSYIYLRQGDYPNYLAEARKAAQLAHDQRQMTIVNAAERGYRQGGSRQMWNEVLRVQTKMLSDGTIPDYSVAITYARLGDTANALSHLKVSKSRHEASYISIRTDDAFLEMHQDPDFRRLVSQTGLPPLS